MKERFSIDLLPNQQMDVIGSVAKQSSIDAGLPRYVRNDTGLCNKRVVGFTLLELLFNMLLGVILLGGLGVLVTVSSIFLKKIHQESDFQEKLRFVFYSMEQDIQNTGFLGCVRFDLNPIERVVYSDNYRYPIRSDETGLWLTYARGDKFFPVEPQLTSHAPLKIRRFKKGDFKKFELALVTDCVQASIFVVTKVNNGWIEHLPRVLHPKKTVLQNRSEDFFKTYGQEGDAFVAPMTLVNYALKPGGNAQTGKLFRNQEELISGVEQWKIFFGVDKACDGHVDDFLGQWTEGLPISALKIKLQIKKENGFSQSYERIFPTPNICSRL